VGLSLLVVSESMPSSQYGKSQHDVIHRALLLVVSWHRSLPLDPYSTIICRTRDCDDVMIGCVMLDVVSSKYSSEGAINVGCVMLNVVSSEGEGAICDFCEGER
jgi:hypothetical protein